MIVFTTPERRFAAAVCSLTAGIELEKAIDAVKRVLPEAKGTIVKVKSELLERVYKALKMRPGDVLVGGRRREKQKAPQNKT